MRCEKISIKVKDSNNRESEAILYSYVLSESHRVEMKATDKRAAIIICPGGGYTHLSDREAEPIAIKFCAMGYNAFVLKYGLAPDNSWPIPQLELAKAIDYVRSHCEEYNIDENKIIISGFSAGGHLAASVACFWNKPFLYESLGVKSQNIKPNGLLLAYPVITSGEFAHRGSIESLLGSQYDELLDYVSLEKQVSADVPPTFIWHTSTDEAVPVENSLSFASALRRHNVNFELHIYPQGGHGLALADEETNNGAGKVVPGVTNWIKLASNWLKFIGC